MNVMNYDMYFKELGFRNVLTSINTIKFRSNGVLVTHEDFHSDKVKT